MGEILSIGEVMKKIIGPAPTTNSTNNEDKWGPVDDPRYSPEPCPHCGRMLKYKAYSYEGRLFGSHKEECSCPGAEAERERKRQEEERRQREEENRCRMERIERLFSQSRLGRRFRERTFETFVVREHTKKAFEIALDYAQNFDDYREKGEGLFITGGYGVGKTHLAAAIANYLIQNLKATVIFGNVTMLLGQIRQAYSENSDYEEEQVLKELCDVDLLIIDDLGKEKPTQWVEEKLYMVINQRYENYKPIVVTSNLELEEIEQRLENCGGAIVSRIIEMCRGIKIVGPDFRKEKLTSFRPNSERWCKYEKKWQKPHPPAEGAHRQPAAEPSKLVGHESAAGGAAHCAPRDGESESAPGGWIKSADMGASACRRGQV